MFTPTIGEAGHPIADTPESSRFSPTMFRAEEIVRLDHGPSPARYPSMRGVHGPINHRAKVRGSGLKAGGWVNSGSSWWLPKTPLFERLIPRVRPEVFRKDRSRGQWSGPQRSRLVREHAAPRVDDDQEEARWGTGARLPSPRPRRRTATPTSRPNGLDALWGEGRYSRSR